jgi:hypothetical protein
VKARGKRIAGDKNRRIEAWGANPGRVPREALGDGLKPSKSISCFGLKKKKNQLSSKR